MTLERLFFCRVYYMNGQSNSWNTTFIWKLHHWGSQINAQISCGTYHLNVSGTYVNGGEAQSYILLGYPELQSLQSFYLKIFSVAKVHSACNNLPITGFLSKVQMNWIQFKLKGPIFFANLSHFRAIKKW